MKLYFIKMALLLIPCFFSAEKSNWTVLSSDVTFGIKFLGTTVKGSFGGLVADIKFDPGKLEDASIKASVEAKTIETGLSLRNRDLRNNFFEATVYPSITMESIKIEQTGPIAYLGTFKLTMKKVTKEIKIPFLFMKTGEKAEFKSTFSINRMDYGVGESRTGMSDDVTITLDVFTSENSISSMK